MVAVEVPADDFAVVAALEERRHFLFRAVAVRTVGGDDVDLFAARTNGNADCFKVGGGWNTEFVDDEGCVG